MTAPIAPQFTTTTSGDVVVFNSVFWPDLSLNVFKAQMRVIDKNPDPVLSALQLAMLETNRELEDWAAAQILAGYATLDDVPDGEDKTALYTLAVYALAKANLTNRYRDEDTTKTGHNRADDLDMNAETHTAMWRRNCRMIQGVPTVTAILI